MNMKLFFTMVLWSSFLGAQFVGVKDTSRINRFLGPNFSSCDLTTDKKGAYQKAYQCGNPTVSNLLHMNVTASAFIGRQFYMFNDFPYWIEQKIKAESYDADSLKLSGGKLEERLEKDFPATWMYMIVMGTSQYLQNLVAPGVVCPQGQTLVVAQLKYNDSDLVRTWSQTYACMSPSDTFKLHISSDVDRIVQKNMNSAIDWMRDAPQGPEYAKAGKCPRSIKLIPQS